MIIAGTRAERSAGVGMSVRRRPRPSLASRARRQSRAAAVDDADLSRPRAGRSDAAPRRRRHRADHRRAGGRGRWPRRSSPSACRCAFPWIAGIVGWIDPASPSHRGGDRGARRSTGLLKGIRPVSTDDNRSHRLDARRAASSACWRPSAASAAWCSTSSCRTPTRCRSSRHFAARHPGAVDRPRPLRQAGHCRWALRAVGGGHRRAGAPAERRLQVLRPAQLRRRPAPAPPSLRPYADHVLDAFGPDRLIWASDWPPLDLAADYATWRRVSLELLAGLGRRSAPPCSAAMPSASTGRRARESRGELRNREQTKTADRLHRRRADGPRRRQEHPRARRLSAHHPRPSQSRAGRRSRHAAAPARRTTQRRLPRRAMWSSSACRLRSRSRRRSTAPADCSPARGAGMIFIDATTTDPAVDAEDRRRARRARRRSHRRRPRPDAEGSRGGPAQHLCRRRSGD